MFLDFVLLGDSDVTLSLTCAGFLDSVVLEKGENMTFLHGLQGPAHFCGCNMPSVRAINPEIVSWLDKSTGNRQDIEDVV